MNNCTFRRLVVAAALAGLAACNGSTPAPPPPIPQLTITCPPSMEAQSTDGNPVSVTYSPPQAGGGQAPVTLSCSPSPGSLFPGGTTTVTCTAVDSRGISASCSLGVFVRLPPRLLGTGRVLAFGDSITAGVPGGGASQFSVVVSEFAYTITLETLLKERYRQQTPVVLPEGIPGEYAQFRPPGEAPGGADRFGPVLAQTRPDIVLLMEGTNDLQFDQAGIEDAVRGLRSMVQQAKAANVRILLSTVIPQRATGSPARERGSRLAPVLSARIRELAAAENVPLVDMFAVFERDMSLIGIDGLHPTPRGFQVMAQTFFEAIRQHGEAAHPPAAVGVR
jgi:lysophospholipase L1-like esterase